MPSVVWITYYWPDCQLGVTAAERNFEFACGLARRGWNVTVVTRDGCEDCGLGCGPPRTPQGVAVEQLAAQWLRPSRWWGQFRWRLHEFPNSWRFSVGEWLDVRARDFDVLLVSASPYSMIGVAVGRGRPVSVDFRDSLVPPMRWSMRRVVRELGRFGAHRAARRVDLAVHVTPDEERRDRKILRGVPSVVVMSASSGPANVVRQAPPVLTLAFAGTFVKGVKDPVRFLRALSSATEAMNLGGDDVRVELVGRQEGEVRKWVSEANVERLVCVRAHMSQGEVAAVYSDADVLLLLSGHERGVPGSKLYEYLRRDQPILAFGGTDPWLAGLLTDERAGALVATSAEFQTWLSAALDAKRAGSSAYPGFKSDPSRAARHGWQSRVDQLDAHLRKVIP